MAGSSTKVGQGSAAQQAMVGVLMVAGRLEQALNDVCAGYGITHDQYNVLRILRGAQPDGHPRYEIADRLLNRAPDVTRLLDRLERADLVARVRSPADRRLSVSQITRKGLSLLDRMEAEIAAVHDRFAGQLTRREQRELARLCQAML